MSNSLTSFVILVLVIFSAVLLFRLLFFRKKSQALSLIFCLLLILQFSTTKKESLTSLNNDQIRIRDQRLSEYPPFRLPVAHWFEGRSEFRALSRIGQNFAQVIDPNFYFFSNHPRERVGINEIPLYSYLLLPFFIWGALIFFNKASKKQILFFVLVPLFLTSLIGLNSPHGPFSLSPFILVAIVLGFLGLFKNEK